MEKNAIPEIISTNALKSRGTAGWVMFLEILLISERLTGLDLTFRSILHALNFLAKSLRFTSLFLSGGRSAFQPE
ncbi:hypothetical protein [Dyadobacter fermentans]|uniref:hypothetical protein n=1 Tax=Dyadobacter fermentans TaxID=94254 RepID=UPI00019B63CD|nr:hypothetical protein [Dyadobacter fermentans]